MRARWNHDFAVVNLVRIGITTSNGVAKGNFILNPPGAGAGKTSALTVWVTRVGDLAPVQATGGWLVAPGKNICKGSPATATNFHE